VSLLASAAILRGRRCVLVPPAGEDGSSGLSRQRRRGVSIGVTVSVMVLGDTGSMTDRIS